MPLKRLWSIEPLRDLCESVCVRQIVVLDVDAPLQTECVHHIFFGRGAVRCDKFLELLRGSYVHRIGRIEERELYDRTYLAQVKLAVHAAHRVPLEHRHLAVHPFEDVPKLVTDVGKALVAGLLGLDKLGLQELPAAVEKAQARVVERLVDPCEDHGAQAIIAGMSTPVDLKSNFVRELPAENLYRVSFEVIFANNIELEVFVFDTDTLLFSRVASVYDLETYPRGQELAKYNNIPYYRARAGIREFSQLRDAVYFESVTKERLKILCDAWSTVVDKFAGTLVFDARSYVR